MLGPMSDPSSRRATRLARLVILTVALPSLLLTALGVVAVSNEEAAARKRLETLYAPLGGEVADRFNAWMQERLDTEGDALEALAKWALDGGTELPAELQSFVREAKHATNFFVVTRDGGRLLGASPLSPGLEDWQVMEAATPLLGPPDCKPALKKLGDHEPWCEEFCPLALSTALCRRQDGDWTYLEQECPNYETDPAVRALRGLLSGGGHMKTEDFARVAESIADELERIDTERPPELRTLVARRAAGLLEGEARHVVEARHRLQLIGVGVDLVRKLSEQNRAFLAMDMSSEAVPVGDWRRVIISRSVDDMLVGYELVPEAVARALNKDVTEGLEKEVRVAFHPISAPEAWWGTAFEQKKKKVDDDVVWWALLKRTNLAWSIVLELCAEQSFWSLSRSRSGLYLWALVLIALALIGGIGFTLRSVAQEGRLSRLKTDFVSSVSHDLRTPLTSIRMFTESLLMGRVKDPDQQRQYLEVIAEEAERLSRLTERILDFSRMEAGRKAYAYQEEPVEPLFEHTIRSCRPMLQEHDARVEVEVPDDLPEVYGDRDALVEMLINLVTNAIKYSDEAPHIILRARKDGPRVALEVEDHGIGISSADQRRIFEKFHRVDCRRTSEVGGSGIGLSLVEHIVHSHEGRIDVRSSLGRGSTFVVLLPIAGQEGALGAVESTADADSATMTP